jgi:hypothetical protein
MSILFLIADCFCDCINWMNSTNPNTSIETGSDGCAEVRHCFFDSLSRPAGGAIFLRGFSDISVSDCSFRDCSTRQSGGACDLGSTRFSIARCCDFLCWSYGFGQFLFIAGAGVTDGRSPPDHAVSEVTTLSCGTSDNGYGTFCLASPVSAAFRDVNVTACTVYYHGAALYADWGDEPYSLLYFHVQNGSLALSMVANNRSNFPTIEYANFFRNTPERGWPVLFGNTQRMKLRYCVFSENNRILIRIKSEKFDLDFCYFSDAAPSTNFSDLGPNCLANCVTVTYGVFAINSGDCPAVPRPPQSLTSPISESYSQSPLPTAMDSPRETVSESGLVTVSQSPLPTAMDSPGETVSESALVTESRVSESGSFIVAFFR